MQLLQIREFGFHEPFSKIPRLQAFSGEIVKQLSVLLTGKNTEGEVVDVKRNPIGVKRVFYERVHCENEHDRDLLRENPILTGDVFVGDPEGSGEVIFSSYHNPVVREVVHSLNSNSVIVNDALKINADFYQAVKKDAFVFSPETAAYLIEGIFREKRKEIKEFLDFVGGGDVNLIKDYQTMYKEQFGSNILLGQGVGLPSKPGLRFARVLGTYQGGFACSTQFSMKACFVGIARKDTNREKLESVLGKEVTTRLYNGEAFEYKGTIYAPATGVIPK